ncbi:hypothetical protein [Sedimenticola sp.]
MPRSAGMRENGFIHGRIYAEERSDAEKRHRCLFTILRNRDKRSNAEDN